MKRMRTEPRPPDLRLLALSLLLAAVACAAVIVRADPAPGTPTTKPSRPLLDQLNRETQELYRSLDGGVLRVQMPAPRWVNDLANRDNRWERYKLDPEVRQQLSNQRRGGYYGNALNNTTNPAYPSNSAQIGPANNSANTVAQAPPATQPDASQQNPVQQQQQQQVAIGPQVQQQQQATDVQGPQQGVVIVVPPNGEAQQQELIVGNRVGNIVRQQTPPVVPNNLGLVLDEQGHVLVPLYVERESAGERPIRLIGPDGEAVEARYVGSDQQTNLTVLQLPRPADKPAGRAVKAGGKDEAGEADGKKVEAKVATPPRPAFRPVKLSKSKPAEGTLVLYLSPTDESGRLGIWNANTRDYGVVVGVDGQVLGIARYGQFLSGSACQLIADQIIRHGAVKRATLGVIITQIDKDDPLRQQQPLLGERPAVRVDQVFKGSPAEKGGLRQGDVIMALAGESVSDIPSVAAAIAARSGKTELQVLREGQAIDVTVDLEPK
jgi:S1-C subfamily serine protease